MAMREAAIHALSICVEVAGQDITVGTDLSGTC